ncbi:hypothetical protein BDQ94DRAFT_141258 [Aspergillus welwitschiae]|uniref:Uncharacterized protein n=1 Tax=Aspergillus welwitschiae TaxID=1341132 RepID=A0A3F3Q833_9EURO|nr:hypothetical protein BDQ94DRAFT_141258 [Aspergillus welwitschiae]RDH34972.1 hypothetical protein BDQ94DRAFT_141258 [Aspergillus welwitschiae]
MRRRLMIFLFLLLSCFLSLLLLGPQATFVCTSWCLTLRGIFHHARITLLSY